MTEQVTTLFHVVATARNGVIGKENKLPWHFSADLKFFKSLTMDSTIIMGRKTYESIGRPLPGRPNFVLTQQQDLQIEGVQCFNTIEKAILASQTPKTFIIGGATIYEQTLEHVKGIYRTLIYEDFEGDAYYPGVPDNFHEKTREALQKENPLIEVIYYERN